jgi:hypothetical protein
LKARLHSTITDVIHHKHTHEIALSEPFVAYAEKLMGLLGLI